VRSSSAPSNSNATRSTAEAAAEYTKIIEAQPYEAGAYVYRGWARHLAGDEAGALADLGRLTSLSRQRQHHRPPPVSSTRRSRTGRPRPRIRRRRPARSRRSPVALPTRRQPQSGEEAGRGARRHQRSAPHDSGRRPVPDHPRQHPRERWETARRALPIASAPSRSSRTSAPSPRSRAFRSGSPHSASPRGRRPASRVPCWARPARSGCVSRTKGRPPRPRAASPSSGRHDRGRPGLTAAVLGSEAAVGSGSAAAAPHRGARSARRGQSPPAGRCGHARGRRRHRPRPRPRRPRRTSRARRPHPSRRLRPRRPDRSPGRQSRASGSASASGRGPFRCCGTLAGAWRWSTRATVAAACSRRCHAGMHGCSSRVASTTRRPTCNCGCSRSSMGSS